MTSSVSNSQKTANSYQNNIFSASNKGGESAVNKISVTNISMARGPKDPKRLMRAPANSTHLMGFEWDAITSKIKHKDSKGSDDIWYVEDDHPEIQCTPSSIEALSASLKTLELSDSEVQGMPDKSGWGLHVHLDIDSAFSHDAKGVHQAKIFFVAMVNIIPNILAYNRVSTKYCDPYDHGQLEDLIKEINNIQITSKTPKEFFIAIRDVVGDEKYTAINLNHVGNTEYGKCGTLEFRFFQSANLPRNVSACLSFINNVLMHSKFANDDHLKLLLKPLEVSPKNLFSIIDQYASDDRVLREEIVTIQQSED